MRPTARQPRAARRSVPSTIRTDGSTMNRSSSDEDLSLEPLGPQSRASPKPRSAPSLFRARRDRGDGEARERDHEPRSRRWRPSRRRGSCRRESRARPVTSEATTRPNASQHEPVRPGRGTARGASRTRSGSNARRRRSGPVPTAMKTRSEPRATRNTASPSTNPKRERESTARASAPMALSPSADAGAEQHHRARAHATPGVAHLAHVLRAHSRCDRRGGQRTGGARRRGRVDTRQADHRERDLRVLETVDRDGGTDRRHAGPDQRKHPPRLHPDERHERAGDRGRTPHAMTMSRIAWALEAANIGSSRYSTVIADHRPDGLRRSRRRPAARWLRSA